MRRPCGVPGDGEHIRLRRRDQNTGSIPTVSTDDGLRAPRSPVIAAGCVPILLALGQRSPLTSPTTSSFWHLHRELDDLESENVLEATGSGCESESVQGLPSR